MAPPRTPGRHCCSQDEHPPLHTDPVAKAERSPAAKRKASTHNTSDGDTCHTFTSLLRELALIVRNTNRIPGTDATFTKTTKPNRTQAQALELAGLTPIACSQQRSSQPEPQPRLRSQTRPSPTT